MSSLWASLRLIRLAINVAIELAIYVTIEPAFNLASSSPLCLVVCVCGPREISVKLVPQRIDVDIIRPKERLFMALRFEICLRCDESHALTGTGVMSIHTTALGERCQGGIRTAAEVEEFRETRDAALFKQAARELMREVRQPAKSKLVIAATPAQRKARARTAAEPDSELAQAFEEVASLGVV